MTKALEKVLERLKGMGGSSAPEAPIFEQTMAPGTGAQGLGKKLLMLALASGTIGAGVTGLSGLIQHRHRLFGGGSPPPEEETPAKMANIHPLSPEHLWGDAAQHWSQVPWAVPAGLAAILAPMLMGSRLAQRGVHGMLKNRDQQDMDQAQKEYEQAMLGMYRPEQLPAPTEKVSAALDKLYEAVEKRGNQPLSVNSNISPWLGPIIAAMLASGAAGTYAGYRWSENRKPSNLLAEAKETRDMLRSQAMPAPISVQPHPRQLEVPEEQPV